MLGHLIRAGGSSLVGANSGEAYGCSGVLPAEIAVTTDDDVALADNRRSRVFLQRGTGQSHIGQRIDENLMVDRGT